jgi:aminoglycoside phosphotransferase (APT) family kinase protein
VDAALVEELVRDQHSDLAELEIREISAGFDNTIWRLGANLAVRLPRRAIAARLMEHELRWLPELAPQLSLEIPVPVRVGRPSDRYPWPWSITKWIDGTPGNDVQFDTRGGVAAPLGLFLRSLHVAAPSDAPFNEFRSVPLRHHEPTFRPRLDVLANDIDLSGASDVLHHALEAPPWSQAALWIHGDLHPANTIIRDGQLVGVIDFGDLCAGDPSTDLAGAFLSLPLSAIDVFFDAYGEVDAATRARSLGWAVHFGLMFIVLGVHDDVTYGPIGHRALENAIAYSRAH